MKSKVVLIPVVVAAALTLVACSGPSSSAPTSDSGKAVSAPVAQAANVDACKVLTKEIVESVVGPVNEPKTDGSGGIVTNCNYLAKDFSGIGLLIRSSTSATTFEEAFKASKSLSGVDPVRVEGLGDSAYWAGGNLNQLAVLKNGNYMIFSAFMAKDPEAITKKLAEKSLANL